MKNFITKMLAVVMLVCVGVTLVGCDDNAGENGGGSGLNPTPDATVETKYYSLNEEIEDNGIKIKVLGAKNLNVEGSSLNSNKYYIKVSIELSNTSATEFCLYEENLILTHYENSYGVHESSNDYGFYKVIKVGPNDKKQFEVVFEADKPLSSSTSALGGVAYSLIIFGESFTYNHEVIL